MGCGGGESSSLSGRLDHVTLLAISRMQRPVEFDAPFLPSKITSFELNVSVIF
jgi:hypothetical protein